MREGVWGAMAKQLLYLTRGPERTRIGAKNDAPPLALHCRYIVIKPDKRGRKMAEQVRSPPYSILGVL